MKKIVTFKLLLACISLAYSLDNNNFVIREKQTRTEYENSICECVPFYLCNQNGTMNSNGEGVIDIRSGITETSDNPAS